MGDFYGGCECDVKQYIGGAPSSVPWTLVAVVVVLVVILLFLWRRARTRTNPNCAALGAVGAAVCKAAAAKCGGSDSCLGVVKNCAPLVGGLYDGTPRPTFDGVVACANSITRVPPSVMASSLSLNPRAAQSVRYAAQALPAAARLAGYGLQVAASVPT